MIRLRLLGTVSVTAGSVVSADSHIGQPKLLALVIFLALARPVGFHQRDRLMGIFWPELGQEQARTALRKALHRVRQAFGESAITTVGQDAVAIPVDERWCDVDDFDRALADGRYGEALECYTGELALGLFVTGAPLFEHWLSGERERLQDAAITAAWRLVDRLASDREFTNATRIARRVARLANGDERVVYKVMSMLAELGDRAGAVRVYREFERRLWNELQLRPAADTTTLAAVIMDGTRSAT
jgi:DNA-binding SARP family transcriptional activator